MRCEPSISAVSYTHLDVYKRQEVDVHIAPRANLGCGIVTHVDVERIDDTEFLVSGRVLIDVYKRQRLGYAHLWSSRASQRL